MFKIEKGVAIPENLPETKARTPYPFAMMEVGDSISVSGDAKAQDKAISACRRYMKAHEGTKFVFGSTGDSVRIWRKA
jgi:hypothetical protein